MTDEVLFVSAMMSLLLLLGVMISMTALAQIVRGQRVAEGEQLPLWEEEDDEQAVEPLGATRRSSEG